MSLIGELYRLQEERGHLDDEALQGLSHRLAVPLYRLEEVVSFYPHFRRVPAPRTEVSVCRDLSCFLAAGGDHCQRIRTAVGSADDVEVHEVSCLGRCDMAPAALVDGLPVPAADPAALAESIREERVDAITPPLSPPAGPRTIDIYAGGKAEKEAYAVFRSYRDGSADAAAPEIISILQQAGLVGMGGAGFPTGRKWELVRAQKATPKYVICNADESEPGTFKDRAIMAELPHLVVEGMCLAALVTGAQKGWIYIRHEYDPERRILQRTIEEARAAGMLGSAFDIEIFVSPGGYILGEETALLEAMEDRRGEPRNKPPYPGQKGLWDQPTLINNVETLAMVPAILRRGADWWKGQGVRGHSGLKFIGVSGAVERPGVFEIPMGTTVAELIELAGGVKRGQQLKAFAPGGASSRFLPADAADVEIDFKSLAEAGSMLGSAALIVLDDQADMVAAAKNVVAFFRNESCGKCVPCRVGTEKVVRMLEDILAGRGNGSLLDQLPALERTLAETSICGLGQVALNPVASAIEHWGDELNAYLAGRQR